MEELDQIVSNSLVDMLKKVEKHFALQLLQFKTTNSCTHFLISSTCLEVLWAVLGSVLDPLLSAILEGLVHPFGEAFPLNFRFPELVWSIVICWIHRCL